MKNAKCTKDGNIIHQAFSLETNFRDNVLFVAKNSLVIQYSLPLEAVVWLHDLAHFLLVQNQTSNTIVQL